MAQPRMNVALGEGGAVLTLLPGSGADGQIKLTPGQLLELIAALGAARARLAAGMPLDTEERGTGCEWGAGGGWAGMAGAGRRR
jgi:hypothetical protein